MFLVKLLSRSATEVHTQLSFCKRPERAHPKTWHIRGPTFLQLKIRAEDIAKDIGELTKTKEALLKVNAVQNYLFGLMPSRNLQPARRAARNLCGFAQISTHLRLTDRAGGALRQAAQAGRPAEN